VKDSGGATLTSYQVDALNRRIVENPGTARDLYYSSSWQVLEERVNGTAQAQYVWSPVYIDALVLRDRDADANTGNGLEERLWAQQDANGNVTSTLAAAGAVAERYAEDPFGLPTFLSSDWMSLSSSAYGWSYLHQGGRYDASSLHFEFRMRDQSPSLGRWMAADPIGHVAGEPNLYRYIENSPVTVTDPYGLWSWAGCRGGSLTGAVVGGGVGLLGGPVGAGIGAVLGGIGGCIAGGLWGEDLAGWATGNPNPSEGEIFVAGGAIGIPVGAAAGVIGIFGGPALEGAAGVAAVGGGEAALGTGAGGATISGGGAIAVSGGGTTVGSFIGSAIRGAIEWGSALGATAEGEQILIAGIAIALGDIVSTSDENEMCDFYRAWCYWGVREGNPPYWPTSTVECDTCYSVCRQQGSWPFDQCPSGGRRGPRWPGSDDPWDPVWPD
jgi:RHS repeat-associated protein